MNLMKLMVLSVAFFSLQAAYANPAFVCKTASKDIHQIKITIFDEAYIIQDNWNGPYKTSDRYTGTILPLNNSVVLTNVEKNPYMKAVLIFNPHTQIYILTYEGFLAPDDAGAVEVRCAYNE